MSDPSVLVVEEATPNGAPPLPKEIVPPPLPKGKPVTNLQVCFRLTITFTALSVYVVAYGYVWWLFWAWVFRLNNHCW